MQHVSCIQMTSGEDVKENLLTAKELIRQAYDQGARLIVLPENFALMAKDPQAKLKHQEKLNHGPIQEFLMEQCTQHKIWIVGGTIPLATENKNKVSAACLVYNDEGKCIAQYNKIHLFDVKITESQEVHNESQTIQPGENIVVVTTPFGKLGLAICYDVRFPEMFRMMQAEGVELIALPSAFTFTTGAAHWEILIRARAIENLCYVLAAAQTGTHQNGRKTYGHSMIVNPWGEAKAALPQNIGAIVAEINLDYLHQVRKDFPALSHRKLATSKS